MDKGYSRISIAVLFFITGDAEAAEQKRPELLLPLGHSWAVTSVALSEDGKRCLTGSADQTAILWDAESGKPLKALTGHANWVTSVALSSDGKRALTGSLDRTAILWDVGTAKPCQTFKGHSRAVSSVALSTDGKRILTGSEDTTAILWDADTGKPMQTLRQHDKPVTSAALSGDGKRALTGSLDTTAIVWDTETGKPLRTFKGHDGAVKSVALGRAGTRVLTGSEDTTAILWDAESGKPIRTLRRHDKSVTSVALSENESSILTGSRDRTAILWDVATGKPRQTFKSDTSSISSVALSRNGRRVLTGSSAVNAKAAILWDAETGTPSQTFQSPTERIDSIALGGDGNQILIGSKDKTATLWDAGLGRLLQTFRGHTEWVRSVAMTKDGRHILTGSFDNTAKLWHRDTARPLETLRPTGAAVALCEAGSLAVIGSDSDVSLWEVKPAKLLKTFRGHRGEVTSVEVSGDGRRILSGSYDHTAILWDVDTSKPVQSFNRHRLPVTSVAFSSDGKRVLTGSQDRTAILWDADTGKPIQILQGHTDSIESVAVSRDGTLILTASADATACLWDARSGKRLQSFQGHNGDITSIAFGPKERSFVTASADGTVRIWTPGRLESVFSFLRAGEEWVFWTPEGYYTCSPNGEALIAWKVKDDSPQGYRIVGPDQFRKQFHRPDLFRHLLAELDLTRALTKADRESGRNPTRPSRIEDALPPVVIIARPLKSGESIKTEVCEIAAKAKPVGDNYVASLRLLIDGRPYQDGFRRFEPRPGETTATWRVELTPGKRRIQIAVESVQGSTSLSEEIEVVREDQRETLPKLLLMGVGVSAYEKVDRKGVEFAADDVKRFLEAQGRHGKPLYPDVESISLTDTRARKADILDALDELGKKARRANNSVTMVYLAGHGKTSEQGEFYFLAADSDATRLRATAISGAELKDALKNITGKVIVFLDTCHSGAFAGDASRSTGLTDDLFRELTSPECGVVVICSSRGKELSAQNNAGKVGYFTQAVVEGLSGKAPTGRNGAVYLPDLFAYVSRRVKELTDDRQHPYASELKKVGDLPLTKP